MSPSTNSLASRALSRMSYKASLTDSRMHKWLRARQSASHEALSAIRFETSRAPETGPSMLLDDSRHYLKTSIRTSGAISTRMSDVTYRAGRPARPREPNKAAWLTRSSLQGGFVLAQLGKDVLLFHGTHSTRTAASPQSASHGTPLPSAHQKKNPSFSISSRRPLTASRSPSRSPRPGTETAAIPPRETTRTGPA